MLSRAWGLLLQHLDQVNLVVGLIVLIFSVFPGLFYAAKIFRWCVERSAKRRLRKRGCNPEVIEKIKPNYIRPSYQLEDPAQDKRLLENSPLELGPFRLLRELIVNLLSPPRHKHMRLKWRTDRRQDLTSYIDRQLRNGGSKFILLLADTGMGKTTFLVSYNAHRLLRQRDSFEVEYLPLREYDETLRKIREMESKDRGKVANTVLLLDALDENPLASESPCARLLEVLNQSKGFYRVLVTCRTQLFGRGNEPPTDSGVPINPLEFSNASHGTHKIETLYFVPI
jgi:hypothetical protein